MEGVIVILSLCQYRRELFGSGNPSLELQGPFQVPGFEIYGVYSRPDPNSLYLAMAVFFLCYLVAQLQFPGFPSACKTQQKLIPTR